MPRILIPSIKQWLRQKRNGYLVASALLMGLSAPGFGLWPLAWLSLALAFFALQTAENFRHAWIQGVVWGMLYHGMLFGWFWGMHPVTWMGFSTPISWLLTGLGWGVATATQGLITGVIWLLWHAVWQRGVWRYLGIPLFWAAGLWLLNQNPIGLPWGFLSYSQAPVAWIRQSVYGLSFWGLECLMVLVNLLVFEALRLKRYGRLIWPAVVFLVCPLVSWLHVPAATEVLQRLRPVTIQGNVPIEAERLYLNPEAKRRYYQALIQAAVRQSASVPRLVVLPEGVVSLATDRHDSPFRTGAETALLAGGIYRSPQGYHNGAILFMPGQTQFFAKRYRVPFGETTPFIPEDWIINLLQPFGIDYGRGFAQAPASQPLLHAGSTTIGPFICFEALYPNIARQYRREKADLMVTFSNLGWFHQHPLLEKQFLAINQLRSAEVGIPLILATNTGLSAYIDQTGAVLARTQSGLVQVMGVSDAGAVTVQNVDPDALSF